MMIVGLEAFFLDARDIERFDRIADQRELRHQLLRRRRSVGLVVLVDLVAEGLGTGIEDDRDMGRLFRRLGLRHQFPEHRAEAVDGADRQTVGRPRQRRQRMKRAKNVARAVDQVDFAALGDRVGFAVGHRCLVGAPRLSLPGDSLGLGWTLPVPAHRAVSPPLWWAFTRRQPALALPDRRLPGGLRQPTACRRAVFRV